MGANHRERGAIRQPAAWLLLAVGAVCLPAAMGSDPAPPKTVPAPPAEVRPVAAPGGAAGVLNAPGDSAWYELHLDAGQFLDGSVLQSGMDVAVVVHPPGALPPVESDSRWHGPEPVWIQAEASGAWRIEVRAVEKHSRRGDFTLELPAPRPPVPEDSVRQKAQALSTEAKRLLHQNAADGYPQALARYQEAAPLWESAGDRVGLSQALNSMGHIHHRLQDLAKSEECYRRSLEIRQSLGDAVGQGECLHNLAALRSTQGKSEEALDLYRQALELRRRGGDELGQAQTLANLGTVCFRGGDFQSAVDYFEAALPLERDLNARPEMIQTLIGLGAVYHRFGDWQPALDCLQKNQALLREVNYLPGLAFNQLNLGAVYIEVGDLDASVACLKDVPELMQRIRNRSGEAAAWLNLGNAYLYKDDTARALECYGKARAGLGEKDEPAVQTAALVYTGRALVEAGRFAEGRQTLEQALERVRRLGDRRWEAQTLLYLGTAGQGEGRETDAAAHMEQALALSREITFVSGEVNALFSLGGLERQAGRLEAAAAHLAEGIALVETLRGSLRAQQLRLTFFALMQGFYESYIDTLMRLHAREPAGGHDAEALRVSEQARARLLVEQLQRGGVALEPPVAPELAGSVRRLNHALGLAAADPPAAKGPAPADVSEKLRREMDDLQGQYRNLRQRLRAEAPAYADLVQPEAPTLPELQSLLEPGTVLLEYSLGRERSYLWAVSPDRLASFVLPPVAGIEESARRLYGLLTERNHQPAGESFAARQRRVDAADRAVPDAAAELGHRILPAGAIPPGTRRLVVVAGGILQWIPFDVLPVPATAGAPGRNATGGRLLDRCEVVYLPSATALRARRGGPPADRPAGKVLAVFADPVFSASDARVIQADVRPAGTDSSATARDAEPSDEDRAGTPGAAGFPRLPFSRAEADAIARLAPAGTVRESLDFQASRPAALDPGLAGYAYIHFATHGLLDAARPERSGLVLSLVDERGRPQNGILRLADIYGLRLPARLVALSACQTALGRDVRGEGLLSLTRGFMYAGAERVLASVWKVDDEATARLMEEFYRRVLGPSALPPAQALQDAQRAIRRQKRWSAPYFWAGFVLQGEWRGDRP